MFIAVDTDFPDSAEALEFCELLEEDDRACWYLIRLWKWGLDANREDGTIPAAMARVPARVSARVQYLGDPRVLWHALTTPVGPELLPWLLERPDGSYYMRGWSRMARFFKERARLRNLAEKRKKEREQRRDDSDQDDDTRADTQDGTQDDTRGNSRGVLGNPSRSRSRSLEGECIGLDQISDDDDLTRQQVEQLGYPRFHGLVGETGIKVARLCPVKGWEMRDALGASIHAWGGFVTVIRRIREEQSKPKPPPAGEKPLSGDKAMIARATAKIRAKEKARKDKANAGQ